MEDLYQILGVEKTSSQEEIKKAYRLKAKEHHPDKGGDEEFFKKISHANDVLSNEEKRTQYDNGTLGRHQHGHNPFADIVNQYRNQQRHNNSLRKGRDIRLDIHLSLEEIYTGIKKKIHFSHLVKCNDCGGTGGKEGVCDQCNGEGMRVQIFNTPAGQMMNQQTCGKCRGLGTIITEPCGACKTVGGNVKQDTISLDIPEGVDDGHTFLVNDGGDYTRNGLNGDLYVVVNEINNDIKYREGNDLINKIKLGYVDFIIGNDYILQTFNGKIKIEIPPLSQVGDKLRIKSKGFKKNGLIGDLIVILELELPKSILPEEKELLTKIKNLK